MDPLEAALASSFTAPNVPPAAAGTPSTPSVEQNPPKDASERRRIVTRSVELEAERVAAMDESWKEAYDERLGHWKAENAVRREQSERTRAEYESRRGTASTTGANTTASSIGGSFVDARDLVSGEGEGGHGREALDHVLSPAAKPKDSKGTASGHGSGEDTSQGWENVASGSLASSYPSINFPPLAATGHPSHGHQGHADVDPSSSQTRRAGSAALALPPIAPPSVTLSIFDSSLSPRARILALTSSLAINLLLPFINGVMLGFGEIAAKSLFGWTGWGNVASQLGLRSSPNPRDSAELRKRLASRGKDTPTLLTLP